MKRSSVVVWGIILGVLLFCLIVVALVIGENRIEGKQTQAAQVATEWEQEVVRPIQTERVAATATQRAKRRQ